MDKLKTTINQIRPDTEIDRDDRVIPYETWLSDKGFIYDNTRMSRGGGVRLYKHPKDIATEVMRQPDKPNLGLQWCIMRASDAKELACGKDLTVMKKKIEKLL